MISVVKVNVSSLLLIWDGSWCVHISELQILRHTSTKPVVLISQLLTISIIFVNCCKGTIIKCILIKYSPHMSTPRLPTTANCDSVPHLTMKVIAHLKFYWMGTKFPLSTLLLLVQRLSLFLLTCQHRQPWRGSRMQISVCTRGDGKQICKPTNIYSEFMITFM